MNASGIESAVRGQLLDRRERLARAVADVGRADDLLRLLHDVDAALERLDQGTFRRCDVCKTDIDDDVLMMHPTIRYCLCNLSPQQQASLEHDLGLAGRVQMALLPRQNLAHAGWETHYRYLPAGAVSGDYCDLVTHDGQAPALYFLVGDVSGKGVAASLLMARLSALFRSLIDQGLPLHRVVERANRLFSESAIAAHYVTVVCGRAEQNGEVEIVNAGHCPPLLVSAAAVGSLDSTGIPVGIADDSSYGARRVTLAPGDSLFIYTDGITEAPGADGRLFGVEGLRRTLAQRHAASPPTMAATCLAELNKHCGGAARHDDLTLLVVRRAA